MYILPLQVSALQFKYKSSFLITLCPFILPIVNIIASVGDIKMKKLFLLV